MNQNSVRSSVGVPPPLPFSVRSSGPPPLPTSAIDFRTEAIRNLKVLGKEFDEYDIELEINRLRSKHQKAEALRRANLERERILGVVSSSGVVPPPLPGSAPLLSSSPPPLPVTTVAAVAELAEAAAVPPLLPGGFVVSPLEDRAEPNFRIEAIRKLKSIGKPFDEYDIELEMEEVKSEYIKSEELRRAEDIKLEEQRREEERRKLAAEQAFLRAKQEAASAFLRAKEEAASSLRAKEEALRTKREKIAHYRSLAAESCLKEERAELASLIRKEESELEAMLASRSHDIS